MYHIYIKENNDWLCNDNCNKISKCKYGYVKGTYENLINRLNDSKEEHTELSYFTYIYSYEKTINYIIPYEEIDKIISFIATNQERLNKVETIYNIKLPLLSSVSQYLPVSKTKQSNEFIYKNGIELLNNIFIQEFPLLGLKLKKIYTVEEINEINNNSSKINNKQYEDKQKDLYDKLLRIYNEKATSNETEWVPRDYQITIDKYIMTELERKKRVYLELATGAGKTYITYNIFNKVSPNIIIIFSPRKNINEQNCSKKYLSILGDAYLVFNYSNGKPFEGFYRKCQELNKKMIIIACPQQSSIKIYDIIIKFNLLNLFIWFDEAHHTIKNWVNNINKPHIKLFLENNIIVNQRLFTSASPDKTHDSKYPDIYSELYKPITVRELIDLKWLCNIKTYIYETNKNNVDICEYNIDNFISKGCKYGFSFHNMRDSALNLFLEHYNKYINDYTNVKPYLLVGNDYKNNILDKINNDNKLNYDYRSIDDFESNNLSGSIGYVVQKFSMGYDFNNIDYIIFSDPKVSYSDIIQSIGRGLRPDGKGVNGENVDKELTIMLPIYIGDDNTKTDFNRIKSVLRYLVYDIECHLDDIIITFSNISVQNNKKIGENYNGNEDVKSILLDLLSGGKYSSYRYSDFIDIMKNNKINNKEDYKRILETRPGLNLPTDIYLNYPTFSWDQTYENSPYYSKKECIEKMQEINLRGEFMDIDDLFDNDEKPEEYLNSIDPKIPPSCLFRFYGGENYNEYY